jgi:hypothetical protein
MFYTINLINPDGQMAALHTKLALTAHKLKPPRA